MPDDKKTRLSKKTIAITSSIAILIAASLIIVVLSAVNKAHRTAVANTEKVVETPTFETLLPSGSSISKLGGWERISPTGAEPVFAYTDEIDGISISVSEQLLPEAFKQDAANNISDLAKKFNATNTLDVSGTKVFLGTSAKGPQSAIFTQNGLLILIKSQSKVQDSSWKAYIQSMTTVIAPKY